MKALISATLLKSKEAQAGPKPFDIRDTKLIGFILRIQPSGVRSYNVGLPGGTRIAIGKVGELTPDEARDRASKVLGNVAHGRPPKYGIDGATTKATGPTLGEFIEATYAPWLRANRPRRADRTLNRIKLHFGAWYERPMAGITVEDVETWRTKRLTGEEGPRGMPAKPATVARDLGALAGVLTRAVKLRKLKENVVRQVEKPRVDRNPKVRFLSTEEEARLRAALVTEDDEGRQRTHLAPAVLISMNTGLRRGELLALTWEDVTLTGDNPRITVQGEEGEGHQGAKSNQTRHVPLNAEALGMLRQWRAQNPQARRVFEANHSFSSSWKSLLKRADITRFRWHDLRHHFASKLVQAGVPLNTVRDLMGHADITMTLRYAHLAPDQRKYAVEMLVPKPVAKGEGGTIQDRLLRLQAQLEQGGAVPAQDLAEVLRELIQTQDTRLSSGTQTTPASAPAA